MLKNKKLDFNDTEMITTDIKNSYSNNLLELVYTILIHYWILNLLLYLDYFD